MATLIYPLNGVLVEGEGKAANITFRISGEPFPNERTWYKDGREIADFTDIK